MRTTRTLQGAKARESILKGVNAIYKPVKATLGPEGKNALLFRTYNRGSRITNDGYTVAECQTPKDPFVRLAAAAFREGCKRTNEKVGDGTTTTATIGGSLFNEGYNLLAKNKSDYTSKRSGSIGVMSLRNKILASAEEVKKKIKEVAIKVDKIEDLEKIATVSVEDAELGKVIAKMAWDVGTDGFIDVVEGYKGEIETEVIHGMRFPAKVSAKAFVNNQAKYEMVAEDCPVLITNYAMDNASEVGELFRKLNGATSKIIVIAPSYSDSVLINMVEANKQGYSIYPVKAPSLRTEQFEDLAIYCGAEFIDKAKGKLLRTVTDKDLGFLEKIIVKDTEAREDAVATGGRGESMQMMTSYEKNSDGNKVMKEELSSAVRERIKTLKSQVDLQQQDNFKKLLERRIGSMASAIGVIKVGDSTQASSLYRKLKIEDAVYACKAALRGGYVKGGGLCLKEIADKMEDTDILKVALMEPYNQIQSSVDGGLDIPAEVIDPMEVVYYAVEHSVGVVSTLLTVDIITPEEEDAAPGDGELAISRALTEIALAQKIHYGQLKENEAEIWKDGLNGLTPEEASSLDNG